MENFKAEKNAQGHTIGISHNGIYVLHTVAGSVITEANIDYIVDRLNKSIESQLSSNPLQLTCESCVQVDCPMYLEAVNYSVVESKNDFYCNFYSPKDIK